MVASEETTPAPTPREEISPGERLRRAREARGLELTEIAANLRLRLDTVRAMEEGRWDSLPGKAFVLGYVRSYCKFLDVPPDPLLAQILDEWEPEDSPTLTPRTNAKPVKRGHGAIWGVTYLLIGLLGILIMMVWEGNIPFFSNELLTDEVSTEQEKSVGEEMVTPLTASEINNSKAKERPMVSPQRLNPASRVSAEEPESLGEDFNERLAETASSVAPAPITEDHPAGEEVQGVGGSVPAQLSLHLRGDSWVEVFDSTGEQLVYKLLKAGTTLELTGTAPLHAIIGNALAANVEFNGQPLDLVPYTQGNVARFTVGEN
ncbi:RodZ domain-containing protein [Nitrosococcus wardiae]|nr:RodZ domain-containing protein [Nitrosococcus wardiae]